MADYWALATTLPNCEKRAASGLAWQGIVSFSPMCKRISYKGGIRHERNVFMFPGYLFVRVVDAWRSLLLTRGISSVVGGFNPSRLPDGLVERLIAKQKADGENITLPWNIGQTLRVRRGALGGELVIYEGMGRRAKERVLLRAMGGYVPIEIDGIDLEAAVA